MDYKKIVVAGGGVLGSQIAFQAAYCGFDVTIWLRSEGSVKRCQPKLDTLKTTYLDALKLMNSDEGKSVSNWCRGLVFDGIDFNYDELVKKVENAY